MTRKRVAILGSTGSIGRQALDVIAATIRPCHHATCTHGTSAIAAPAISAAANPPSAPSTVFFGESRVSRCVPNAVPISIAKMSVKATMKMIRTVQIAPSWSARIATKYVSSLPMYSTHSSV